MESKPNNSISGGTIIASSETIDSTGGQSHAIRKDLDALAEQQKSDKNTLWIIMTGVVIFVVVTFLVELITLSINYSQDKSILLQNNQLNKDYFDKVLFLNNEVQDVKTQIETLKARNPYLK